MGSDELFDIEEFEKENAMDSSHALIPDGETNVYHYINSKKTLTVTLSKSVEVISRYDFAMGQNLKVINISSSVEKIDKDAFTSLKNLEAINVDSDNQKYKSVDGVLYNKGGTLLIRCPLHKKGEIKIEKNCTTISKQAFHLCEYISKVDIPEGLKRINHHAFYFCKNLEGLHLPSSLNTLYPDSITCCDNLNTITVSIDNPKFTAKNNILYNKDKTILYLVAPSVEGEYTIPQTIKEMYNTSFYNSNLSVIKIPRCVDLRNVMDPDYGVFSTCHNLERLIFEDKTVIIKEVWFSSYWGYLSNYLEKFITDFYPAMLTSSSKERALPFLANYLLNKEEVDDDWYTAWISYLKRRRSSLEIAFLNYPRLLEAVLKEKIFNLEETKNLIKIASTKSDYFEASSLLLEYQNNSFTFDEIEKQLDKEINVNTSSVAYIKKNWKYKVEHDDTITLLAYQGLDTDIIVPEKVGKREVKSIGWGCFNPRLNNTRKESVFQNLLNITSIYIPSSIKHIDVTSIACMPHLQSVTLPESWVIDFDATLQGYFNKSRGYFYDCPLLTSITIPEKVKDLCMNMFYSNTALEHVTLSPILEKIPDSAFLGCTALLDIDIPSSVKKIDMRAFEECTSLDTVTLHEGLEHISIASFRDCDKLKEIFIPRSVKYIGEGNFIDSTIKGYKNSYAQKYANDNGITFIEVKE